MISDTDKTRAVELGRRWQGAVLRGDCSVSYAVQEIVGAFCTPYLSAADASEIATLARKGLGKACAMGRP